MYGSTGLAGYSPGDWGLSSAGMAASSQGAGLLGHRDRSREAAYLSCAVNSTSPLAAGGLAASSTHTAAYTPATPAVASTYPGLSPYTAAGKFN